MSLRQLNECFSKKYLTESTLPNKVLVRLSALSPSAKEHIDDEEWVADEISDYLSDTYGYCHNGFDFDVDYNEHGFPMAVKVFNIDWDMSESLNEAEDDYIRIGNKIYPKDASKFGYASADEIDRKTKQKIADDERAEKERIRREEEEKKLKELQAQAEPTLNKIKEKGVNDITNWFGELVPRSGKCDTQAGELVRAINKIGYRDLNDGDKFMAGYGLETCGAAACFLMDKIPAIDRLFKDMVANAENYVDPFDEDSGYNSRESKAYTAKIEEAEQIIINHILSHPELLVLPNEDDMLEWDDEWLYENQPSYDWDFWYHEEDIDDYQEEGIIDGRDIQEWVERTLDNNGLRYDSVDVDEYDHRVWVYGMNYDDARQLAEWFRKGNLWKWYSEELHDEFGDPVSQDDEDDYEDDEE